MTPPCSKDSITPLPAPAGHSGVPEVGLSSGLPSPPSSPPLAALTTANELALAPKTSSRKRDAEGTRKSRRGGAAYTIREECERLFCETMKTVFLGERDLVSTGSSVMGANANSPPDESASLHGYFGKQTARHVDAWLEVWDYAGGCSFRGFVAGTGDERSLFVFFDSAVIGRDLKQGLMALIELAGLPFNCSQIVICVDQSVDPEESKVLLKSLRWVGFELINLDMWSPEPSSGSDKWRFLGMEL